MSNTIEIVYVGEKPVKRDTVTGSRLVFRPNLPVPVPTDIALQLLAFPKVWIETTELQAHQDEQAKQAEAKAQLEIEALQQAKQAALDACMVVNVGGMDTDLSKLNSAKLNTLIEANGIAIDPKGAQELVEDFRLRLRDHLRK